MSTGLTVVTRAGVEQELQHWTTAPFFDDPAFAAFLRTFAAGHCYFFLSVWHQLA